VQTEHTRLPRHPRAWLRWIWAPVAVCLSWWLLCRAPVTRKWLELWKAR